MSPFVASILSILARKAIEYAKDWAMKSARPRGEWLGKVSATPVDDAAAVQAGYKSGTPCRLILADERDPLRWRHESGVEYRVGDGISDCVENRETFFHCVENFRDVANRHGRGAIGPARKIILRDESTRGKMPGGQVATLKNY